MIELYWITRCDSFIVLFTIVLVLMICIDLFAFGTVYADNEKQCYNILRKTVFPIVISALGILFIPSTKEALMIYGIGGTIDYIKNNDKAKQLPDKCIEALDKWVENLNENKNKETNG